MVQSKPNLYIIAAGKGSRMNIDIPKALVLTANKEPNIVNTLNKAKNKFSRIYVVYNKDAMHEWTSFFNKLDNGGYSYKEDNVFSICISSGLGDGNATLVSLISTLDDINSDVVICWGDAFIKYEETFSELINKSMRNIKETGVVPVVYEENPYVALRINESYDCIGADMTKLGEYNDFGYHDQSIFRFKKLDLYKALSTLNTAFYKNGKYITPNNEFSLLYVFHYLWNIGMPVSVYETEYPVKSFNTQEELNLLLEDIINE